MRGIVLVKGPSGAGKTRLVKDKILSIALENCERAEALKAGELLKGSPPQVIVMDPVEVFDDLHDEVLSWVEQGALVVIVAQREPEWVKALRKHVKNWVDITLNPKKDLITLEFIEEYREYDYDRFDEFPLWDYLLTRLGGDEACSRA